MKMNPPITIVDAVHDPNIIGDDVHGSVERIEAPAATVDREAEQRQNLGDAGGAGKA